MSTRAGWTINGQHFTETRTERGGLRYFIDGKPTRKSEWLAAMVAAHVPVEPAHGIVISPPRRIVEAD